MFCAARGKCRFESKEILAGIHGKAAELENLLSPRVRMHDFGVNSHRPPCRHPEGESVTAGPAEA